MPLSVNFTDIEFEYVREMTRLPKTEDNIATLISKLDALNAAEVLATQRDIDKWQSIEYGTEKSKGGIKGTDYDTERNRQYIRNKVRDRLGLDRLPDPLGLTDLGAFTLTLPGWMGSSEDEYSQS
jgi:hypothetical protein